MSRKDQPTVRLTEEQLASHIAASLINIRHLCEIFDSGHHYIAFTLTSEIHRFLVSGQRALQIRGDRRFPSPAFEYNSQSIGAELKLIAPSGAFDKPEAGLSFAPFFDVRGLISLPFRDWWNREVIYRSRVAEDERNNLAQATFHVGGRAYIAGEEFKRVLRERRSLTRRTFVELVRNKFGAHLDNEVPETLSELLQTDILGLDVVFNGRSISDSGVSPVAAMVRQIAYEVVLAFDEEQQNKSAD